MIIFNNLTQNGTCESVDVFSGEKAILTVDFKEKTTLLIQSHKTGKTNEMSRIGIIDNGAYFELYAYNNRIRIVNKNESPYRGVK